MKRSLWHPKKAISAAKFEVEIKPEPTKSLPHPTPESALQLMTAKRWGEAVRAWRVITSTRPDANYLIQYGHALKESGLLNEARVAYSSARSELGDTQDILMQLGHLSKLAGEFAEAAVFYKNAYLARDGSLSPEEIQRELLNLRPLLTSLSSELEREPHLFLSCASKVDISASSAEAPRQLGSANYSYSFAMRGFINAAEALDIDHTFLNAPHYVPDSSELTLSSHCVHLCFAPPYLARLLKGAYNVLCFAWEFPLLPDEANWAHAFANPKHMLNLFDEIWVGSDFAANVVREYTKKPVRVVPSPIPKPKSRRNTARSNTAFFRALARVDWVPLSIFPRLQPNFNNHAVSRQQKLHQLFNETQSGNNKNVFLSVFNPHDLRKQIGPLLRGFIEFSKSEPDAILLLKTSSPDDTNRTINERILTHQLAHDDELIPPAVSRRIWLTTFSLTDTELEALYRIADFYVCTSHCEGQNLPLMEAMIRGIVPVSVNNTAMADYISHENAVIIEEQQKPSPAYIQLTYRMWNQKTHIVAAQDVANALHAASALEATDRESKRRAAIETVAGRFGVELFRDAIAPLLARP